MDRMIYVGMTGAKQTMLAQAVNAHNLANASTNGFRADLHVLASRPVDGPGFATRVNSVTEAGGWDARSGAVMNTGRELDVAVDGDGWIAVQASDGTEAYTRAGSLRTTSDGLLETASGHLVLGEGGPVSLPEYANLTVGGDGTLTIVPLGQGPETVAQIDRIRLVRPDPASLVKGTDGLMRLADGATAVPDASVRLVSRALEGSNVDVAQALVRMIELSRQYEMQVKVMSAAEENADRAVRLLQLG